MAQEGDTETGLILGSMPRKVVPLVPFGRRLVQLRNQRGLTQTQLAEKIDSTQRIISLYETVAELPPAHVVVSLAKALKVSADKLLGLKPPKKAPEPALDLATKRLWKKSQLVQQLPERDQRAVMRMISAFVENKKAS
ncbi:MAG: helix-turn-helix domain-containing protein [Proteobacteria bacterium]|nr:helix-turn-helix domain-containing protein [Pseudomonadota bacterium]